MDDRLTIVPGASIRSQVLEFYREAIRSGRLSEGAVLPPARKLAAEVGTAEANVHYAIAQLARECPAKVIAEGHIHTPEQAVQALYAGAFALVVGGAITRPAEITARYTAAINNHK